MKEAIISISIRHRNIEYITASILNIEISNSLLLLSDIEISNI